MTTLNLYFFGPPRIEMADQSLEVELRKGLALLAYLAVTNQAHSRDALSTLFWPDADQSHPPWQLYKDKASALLAEGAALLPPERAVAAEVRGKSRDWVEVVSEILSASNLGREASSERVS